MAKSGIFTGDNPPNSLDLSLLATLEHEGTTQTWPLGGLDILIWPFPQTLLILQTEGMGFKFITMEECLLTICEKVNQKILRYKKLRTLK